MGKETVTQFQEAQRVPYEKKKKKTRRNTLRHMRIKLTIVKYKKKNIKSNKGKSISNIKGKDHKVISWIFSRISASQKRVACYI